MKNKAENQSVTPSLDQLIAQGALFVVNHSGGKDSQAMLNHVAQVVPLDQIVVIYAHLKKVTWPGTEDQARAQAERYGLRFESCLPKRTFFEMVKGRKHWPTPDKRQCTSDLKRTPLEVLIRRLSRELGRPLVVDCQGLRGEESKDRKARKPWAFSKRLSKAGRTVWTWLPIHGWTLDQVFASEGHTVADWRRRVALWKAGRKGEALDGWRFHWAYAAGMTRLSCCFCIMSSQADLKTAATLRPDLLLDIVNTEIEIGHTFKAPKKDGTAPTLDQYIAAIPDAVCTY